MAQTVTEKSEAVSPVVIDFDPGAETVQEIQARADQVLRGAEENLMLAQMSGDQALIAEAQTLRDNARGLRDSLRNGKPSADLVSQLGSTERQVRDSSAKVNQAATTTMVLQLVHIEEGIHLSQAQSAQLRVTMANWMSQDEEFLSQSDEVKGEIFNSTMRLYSRNPKLAQVAAVVADDPKGADRAYKRMNEDRARLDHILERDDMTPELRARVETAREKGARKWSPELRDLINKLDTDEITAEQFTERYEKMIDTQGRTVGSVKRAVFENMNPEDQALLEGEMVKQGKTRIEDLDPHASEIR